ncbi:MAG: ABC transporter ATP-binding protein [Methanothrix sp.]
MKYAISINGIGKRFGNEYALKDISLELGKGITLILGPNGAGKSTLLRCMAGLYKPDEGRVKVLGKDPYSDAGIRKRISFMPDNYGLYDFLSVRDNILFFSRLYGVNDDTAISKAMETLKMLDADGYINTKVGQLSRGTKQKMLFCKALVNDPDVILLDEPTAFLDASSSAQVREALSDLAKAGKCVVFVTQRVDEATRFNSRICVIRNGRIIKDTDTRGLYNEVLSGITVSIRLARPIRQEIRSKLGKNVIIENGNIVKARIRAYRDINEVIERLIKNGAYIASVDYAEPMIEKLYAGDNDEE